MRIRRRFVFIPLLSLIVLYHLQEKPQQSVDVFKVPVDTNELPDYYMEGLAIRNYDESGNLQAKIETSSLLHYAGQKQAQMVAPKIILVAENDQIWTLESNRGRILDESQDISLEDNVVVRLGSPNRDQLQLETETLYYEFTAHRVWNQDRVFLSSLTADGSAQGIMIDLNTEQFELHNDVKIQFKN